MATADTPGDFNAVLPIFIHLDVLKPTNWLIGSAGGPEDPLPGGSRPGREGSVPGGAHKGEVRPVRRAADR